MGGFYMNITSQNNNYDNWNITSDYNHSSNNTSTSVNNDYIISIHSVVTYIIISISLPLTLVAIYALYSQIRNDNVGPIYVINLLISDIIQLCCMIVWVVPTVSEMRYEILNFVYIFSLVASVGFMVCIALERYLVVACPLWYRFTRTIKISVGVCVVVWTLALVFRLPLYAYADVETNCIILGVFFFFPLLLFIFFLGGTLKALSATRVPSDEKRRIVALLVLVLLIYTLLFLPNIVWYLSEVHRNNFTFDILTLILFQLSPLADLILYIFMRKGTVDKLLSSVCCCRMDSDDTNSSSV